MSNTIKLHKLNKQVEVACLECDTKYRVKPSRVSKTKYCSTSCRAKQKRGPQRICSIQNCGRKHDSKNYCSLHVTRYRATGDPLKRKIMGSPPKHGMSYTPEYRAWSNMLGRCYRITHRRFRDYGGRGIKVCEQWRKEFTNFYEDMGKRPSIKHSLERVDNEKGYEPSNCRWATYEEQNRNRRNVIGYEVTAND